MWVEGAASEEALGTEGNRVITDYSVEIDGVKEKIKQIKGYL